MDCNDVVCGVVSGYSENTLKLFMKNRRTEVSNTL